MPHRTFLATLVALLVLVAPAHAANMASFTKAQDAAARYFPPPCGHVTLKWSDTIVDATWVADADWGAYALPDQCEIVFKWEAWQWSGPIICTAMVHEYGHLMGFEHSTDPRSIMFPGWNFVPRRCLNAKGPRRSGGL